MEYMTVREAARRWNVTERLVQRLCAEGRIEGAAKFGGSWGIPVSAHKPDDPRRAAIESPAATRPRRVPGAHANLMPLMNTAFEPGHCCELAESFEAESAGNPQLRAAESFIASTASVLLHLPAPDNLPDARAVFPLLPPGLRTFACYVQAHMVYLKGNYAESLGIAEATLMMQEDVYPIPAIYLHLVAVMDLMGLRETERAREHLLAAWELARPDDLIEPFGEHHGLLGGMLEAAIKPAWPEDFKRIIAITYRFSAGWRRIHNPETGDDVADDLTTTEFAASMLAARGWTNHEIARHMGVSVNTVKSYISRSLAKLGIKRRQDLGKFMLS